MHTFWQRQSRFGLRVLWRVLSGALLGVLLSGCANQPHWPDAYGPDAYESSNLTSIASTRRSLTSTILTNVPFHPQEKYQCGPASLAMMLNAQNVDVLPDELVDRVYLPQRKGALQVEMVAAARQYGMLVYPLAPKLESILDEVRAGHPVLILQNLRFEWWPQWHFAVVIGYDSVKRTLILHSGIQANYRQPATVFMATWNRSERWARVILPPDKIPSTAEPLTFLMAAHDLETTRQTIAATSAYKAALRTWPDQPAALLGLGNIAYQQAQWSEAEGYYRAMTDQFPDISAGWNNLAEALLRQGKHEESTDMMNKALETGKHPESSGAS
ncbi:hypothetical protein LCGC14_1462380 [marine sediment metagenome]|uniref:Peptidase C39-like domain-containing protein n=1 Tax=marine sediment metagenome TaxID=412755 RepID=A0A0F9MGS6_9ZZZZ